MKKISVKSQFKFIITSADKTRQECHDETITEMVTETIMEQQCTGKKFPFPNEKNPLNCIFILS